MRILVVSAFLVMSTLSAHALEICDKGQLQSEKCMKLYQFDPTLADLERLEEVVALIDEDLVREAREQGNMVVRSNVFAALTASKNVCTEELLEENFEIKDRCDALQRRLSEAHQQLAELRT